MRLLTMLGTWIEQKRVIFNHRFPGGVIVAINSAVREPIPATELAEALSDYNERGDPEPVVNVLAAQGEFSEAGERKLAEFAQQALDLLGMPVFYPEQN